VLLLRDLLKHLPPNHPDYGQVTDAYDQFTEKAAMLNEKKREAEVPWRERARERERERGKEGKREKEMGERKWSEKFMNILSQDFFAVLHIAKRLKLGGGHDLDEQTLGLTVNRKRKFLKEVVAYSSSVSDGGKDREGGRWSLLFFDDLLLVCVGLPKGELVTSSNPSSSSKKGSEKKAKVKFAFYHDRMNIRDLPDLFKFLSLSLSLSLFSVFLSFFMCLPHFHLT
jgi:hypothetical protein